MDNQLLDTDFINNNKEGKSLNEILLYGYETHSTDYIIRGYELFKANAGSFIGFLFLAFFIRIFASLIPIIGGFLTIPLMPGAYIVAKKTSQNEDTQFGNFFDGYKKFTSILGSTIIQALIIVAIFLIAFLPLFLTQGTSFLDSYMDLGSSEFTLIAVVVVVVMTLILIIYVIWLFSSLLILFNDSNAWQSLEISRKVISKKFFNWVGFILLLYVLNIAGAVCFLIGLLITIPTSFCAIYIAYEDVVGLNLKD